MLEGVERLSQVFVVEFEVGEFELERVVLCFEAIGTRHHSIVICPWDNVVVAGGEEQCNQREGYDESFHSVRSISLCRRPTRCRW